MTMKMIFPVLILGVWVSTAGYGQHSYPVHYTLSNKIEVTAGKAFTIPVSFTVDSSWYIYAPTGNNAAQGMLETSVIYQLPKGITRKGKLILPPTQYKGGFEVYMGSNISINQQFVADKPGEYIINAKIYYQTCNEQTCLPPVTEEVAIAVRVTSDSATAVITTDDFASLTFTAIDGRKVNFAKLKGKVVIVDCWATWCRPCIAEFTHLKKLYAQYHSRGLEIIGISMDEAAAREKVTALVKQHALPWPQYFEGQGFAANSIVIDQGIVSLPAVFLMGKDGKVIARDARGEKLELLVKQQLNKYTRY